MSVHCAKKNTCGGCKHTKYTEKSFVPLITCITSDQSPSDTKTVAIFVYKTAFFICLHIHIVCKPNENSLECPVFIDTQEWGHSFSKDKSKNWQTYRQNAIYKQYTFVSSHLLFHPLLLQNHRTTAHESTSKYIHTEKKPQYLFHSIIPGKNKNH